MFEQQSDAKINWMVWLDWWNMDRDYIKLRLHAKVAKPSPSINVVLGPKKINVQDFCKRFNELTNSNNRLEVLCVKVYLYSNKSYDIVINNPPITCLIKRFLSLVGGSNRPDKDIIGKVNKQHVLKLIKIKQSDINTFRIKYAFKLILGSLKSIGIGIGN